MSQPQRARGGRGAVVMETALQRGDATLPGTQELLELCKQRPQGLEDTFVIFDFMIEIETSAISLASHEAATRIGTTPEQAVEIGEPLDTESLGEPRTRQAHELTKRAHAHAEKTSVFFFRPAQRGERQWFEPRRQHVRVGDETARAGPCRRERSQCGGSEREAWLYLGLRQHRICTAGIAQLAAQLAQATEQRETRLDLEQQAIRRFDGHLWRERGGDAGQ